MIVVVGGLKGGSGKTTAATSLAVLRSQSRDRVLLVDADPQQTSHDFSLLRHEVTGGRTGYAFLRLNRKGVVSRLPGLARKYQDIIVDTSGQDLVAQRAALTLAHLFVTPFVPRSFDFWTLDRVVEMVREARQKNPRLLSKAFLNRVHARDPESREAVEMLSEAQPLQYLPTPLGSRKAFARASAQGWAVTEIRPVDRRANSEIRAFVRGVYE